MRFSWALLALLTIGATAQQQNTLQPTVDCPISGPVFPVTFDISQSPIWQNATKSFPSAIDALFDSGDVKRNNASFVIDFFSTVTGKSVYTYTHVGPDVLNGTVNATMTKGRLDRDSIFRIGSVSKLFTAYALLLQAGFEVFEQPVTMWLPELAGNKESERMEKIVWEDVTVGALMSHQGGVGGFSSEDGAKSWVCLDKPQDVCNRVFLEYMKNKKVPVQAPNSVALYSDGGHGILARVLERMTGLPFGEAITKLVSKPLGLNSTSTFAPKGDFNAFIMNEQPGSWAFDNQVSAGSGGVYSTSADLARLGTAILNSTLLPPSLTNRWLKPLSFTGTLTADVGAPWEIFRAALPISTGSNRTRTVNIFTKGGGQGGYGTIFGVSPEHKLGFSIWVSSPGSQPLGERWHLRGAALEMFLPAAEAAVHAEAKENTEGVFVLERAANSTSLGGNSTAGMEVPVNLTLTVDADRPGVGISKLLYANGTDSLEGMSTRAYPIGIEVDGHPLLLSNTTGASTRDARNVKVRGYRLNSAPMVAPAWRHRSAVEGGSGILDTICDFWLSVGFTETDEMRMEFRNERVERVFLRSTGMTYKRVE